MAESYFGIFEGKVCFCVHSSWLIAHCLAPAINHELFTMNQIPVTKLKISRKISHIPLNSLFLPRMIEFKVTGDFIPMIQLLKAANLVQTGGEAQIAVTGGEVRYNGRVDYRKRLKVKKGDTVEFNGETIRII